MGYKELTKQAEGFTTDEDLALEEGTRYKIKLTTSNRAGLKTVHKTDGVVVDVSPPEVKFEYVTYPIMKHETLLPYIYPPI